MMLLTLCTFFYLRSSIPLGCNSSFITLIQKMDSPLLIKDYHPISLIRMQFKVIAKLLGNRLSQVLYDVIGVEQTALLKC